jgi:hypothetical protein
VVVEEEDIAEVVVLLVRLVGVAEVETVMEYKLVAVWLVDKDLPVVKAEAAVIIMLAVAVVLVLWVVTKQGQLGELVDQHCRTIWMEHRMVEVVVVERILLLPD